MTRTPRCYVAAVATAVLLCGPVAASAQRASDEVRRLEASIEVLRDLTRQPDDGIPQYLLQRAEAIVVVPEMIRGGFVFGAKHGRGVVSVRDHAREVWSPPAFLAMTGGSVGWQIGAQSVDLVLLVMNRRGVDQLLSDRFTVGGELSVVAGPVGRTANAATDLDLESQILAYSRARGLFAGATLEGVSLRADTDANENFYGRNVTVRDIALNGAPNSRPPIVVNRWFETLRDVSTAGGRFAAARNETGRAGQAGGGNRTAGAFPEAAGYPAFDAEVVSIVALTDRPERYEGRRITISAPVEDLYSRTMFSVDDEARQSTGRDVIVISRQPVDRIDQQAVVIVTGTLYAFDRRDLERRLGDWRWDVSDDVLRRLDDRPVILADAIRVADTDVDRTRRGAGVSAPPVTYTGRVGRIGDVLARPKDYYGQQLMLSADVEDVYSRTVFAIDDDKLLSTGRELLVVAPALRRPVTDDMDVTIVGEVIEFDKGDVERRFRDYKLDIDDDLVDAFDDRPVILATSIRTRDGEELLGVVLRNR